MTTTRAISFNSIDDEPIELSACLYTDDARLLSNLLLAEHLDHDWLDYCPDTRMAMAGPLSADGSRGDATLCIEVYIDKEDFSLRAEVHSFQNFVGRGRILATVTLR